MREAEGNTLQESETSTEATSQSSRALGRTDSASFVQYLMFVVKSNSFRSPHNRCSDSQDAHRWIRTKQLSIKWRNATVFQFYTQMNISGFSSIHKEVFKEVQRRFTSTVFDE